MAVLQSRKPTLTSQTICPACKSLIEFDTPDKVPIAHKIQCYSCLATSDFQPKDIDNDRKYSNKTSHSHTHTHSKQERKPAGQPDSVGTDECPIDTKYYDLLEIDSTSTPLAIKKAYYVAAMKWHPDKNLDDPMAETRFKDISEAYQVLSDPQRRSHYNRHGLGGEASAVPFVDPQQFFQQQFGGEKFVSIIGEISIARDFKDAMFSGGREDSKQSFGNRVLERKTRVDNLVVHLIAKLALFTDSLPYDSLPIKIKSDESAMQALNSFRTCAQEEVNSLKEESYGVELLHAVGYTYVLKADQWLPLIDAVDAHMFKRAWGFGSRFANGVREKAHIISETVGTVKTALELQSSFIKIKEIEKKGEGDDENGLQNELTADEINLKAKLEGEAAIKGMHALWRGSKLEVEAVLREVCDQTLGTSSDDLEVRRRRAIALRVLGEVYEKASRIKSEK